MAGTPSLPPVGKGAGGGFEGIRKKEEETIKERKKERKTKDRGGERKRKKKEGRKK